MKNLNFVLTLGALLFVVAGFVFMKKNFTMGWMFMGIGIATATFLMLTSLKKKKE